MLEQVAARIEDADVMALLKMILKATGKRGVAQGGPLSPLLSNIYINDVDRMLERAKERTRNGDPTFIEWVRWADDLVILVDSDRRQDWLFTAVGQRLREEFGKIQVELNEEKSRHVDLTCGDSFSFLGFEFRRVRTLRGVWRSNYAPRMKQRTALLRKLKDIFRRFRSQPIGRVVNVINPILRGWVNYFAVGHSARSFRYIKNWVEEKVRRHLMRARKRSGFGWKRWSRSLIYEGFDLFNEYRLNYHGRRPKALPAQ